MMLMGGSAVTIDRDVMIYHVSTQRADERFAKQPAREYLRWRRSVCGLTAYGLSRSAQQRRAGIVALKIMRVHYARSDYEEAARFLIVARAAPKSLRDAWRCLRYRLKVALALRLARVCFHRVEKQASAR
jgi:hypothetical protein